MISLSVLPGQPSPAALRLLTREAMRRFSVIPLSLDPSTGALSLAMSDPDDFELVSDIQTAVGVPVVPVRAESSRIDEWIESFVNGDSAKAAPARADFRMQTPAMRLVDEIISEAMHGGVSDIHFEPGEREFIVRFRKDGVLHVARRLPVRSVPETISRVKILAAMDIAERRRPQDGRIHFNDGSGAVDIRVSALPTDYGQKIVLRLLDKGAIIHELGSLGMLPRHRELAEKEIRKPYGMFLITGPTGSGKTTTLYTLLQMIRSPELNVSTIEEPIEYKLSGITQTAVNAKIGLTFASALRTLLRQDPDVIMVGEIRDGETAELAIRAALTGHLVFSTLHTNDAPSAIERLVRRVCPKCGGHSADCVHCGGSGFRGRLGIYEMMPVSENIRELIHSRAPLSEIRGLARREGMVTLAEDGLEKVRLGWTTNDEVASEALL